MSDVAVEPVASGSASGRGRAPRKRRRFRLREMTPMGFLMLVALIYLFIMVTFVLATLRSQASLLSQGAFGPLSLGRLRFDWRQLARLQRWHLLHLVAGIPPTSHSEVR